MVRGQLITPAQKRRLISKIAAAEAAEAARNAYLLELNEAGISVKTIEAATADTDYISRIPSSTLHRWIQSAKDNPTSLRGESESHP